MQSSWSWPCQLLCSWSAVGKAALPPQTEPGTARGLAKQVQVRPSIFAMLWGSRPPFPCSIAAFLTRLHPSPTAPSPPAPRTHPVPPFSAFPGGVRFLPSLGPPKFGDDFVAWLAAPLPFEHEKGRDCPPAFSQPIPLTPFCRCRAGNTCLFAPAAPHGCRSRRSYRFPAPKCGRRPGCWTPAGR